MRRALGISAVILAMATVSQATIIIDDYISTDPAGGWDLYATTFDTVVTKSETDLSGVYGGSRDTSYTVGNAGLQADLDFGTRMSLGDGWYSHSNDLSTWSKGTLTYNGGGSGLGLDLTSGTKFSVDASFDHVGNEKQSVLSIIINDGTHTATVAKSWTTYESIGLTTEEFLFSAFTTVNPHIDLSSIDSIALYLETDNAGDYSVRNFSTDATVPEPATIVLLGLGCLVLLKRRNAKKTKLNSQE